MIRRPFFVVGIPAGEISYFLKGEFQRGASPDESSLFLREKTSLLWPLPGFLQLLCLGRRARFFGKGERRPDLIR